MINLVQAPFGMEISNVDLDSFIKGFENYVNKEIVRFLLKDEENVEVTYTPNEKVCRFDNVDVKSILIKDAFDSLNEDEDYSINVDVNLKESKIKLYVHLSAVEYLVEGLCDEEKDYVISEYVSLKLKLKESNFYLEMDDMTGISLVTDNLKSLTVDGLAEAINMVEDFRKSLTKYYL